MIKPSLTTWFSSAAANRQETSSDLRAVLSQLTVVIPCYDRQEFLLRQCVYWHRSGAALVIVDGSPQPLDSAVQKTIAELGDIRYFHYATSVMDRLNRASAHIQTKYAILLGDDEFLLFTGLCSAISRLENDPSLVAVIGQSIAFYPAADDAICNYGTGYPHWRYDVQHASIDERLTAAMSNYTAATCYAVLRAPIWRRSWGQQENWSSPYTGEIQQALTTYIWGKLTTVDEVYWMRSSENRPINIKQFNRGLSFQEWWASATRSAEHEQFISLLVHELSTAHGVQAEDAKQIIRKAIETYISHVTKVDADSQRTQGKTPTQLIRSFGVKFLKRLLPQSLLESLKSAVFGFRSSPGKGNFGTLAELEKLDSSARFQMNSRLIDELSHMETLIAGFYTARRG